VDSIADALPPFPGFRGEAFDFLRELAANNRRDWFKPRKQVFEDEVQWPLRCLVVDVARRAASEGLPLRADPARSLFRIYRDTRFSSNKDPYKTACGAVISRTGTHRDPGAVYVHVEPGSCFLAAGFWRPEASLLRKWRRKMVAEPESFLGALASLRARGLDLDAHDDSLKRLPRGFENVDDEELLPCLRLRSFTVSTEVDDARLARPEFAEEVLRFSRDVMPLLEWGWRVQDARADA